MSVELCIGNILEFDYDMIDNDAKIFEYLFDESYFVFKFFGLVDRKY